MFTFKERQRPKETSMLSVHHLGLWNVRTWPALDCPGDHRQSLLPTLYKHTPISGFWSLMQPEQTYQEMGQASRQYLPQATVAFKVYRVSRPACATVWNPASTKQDQGAMRFQGAFQVSVKCMERLGKPHSLQTVSSKRAWVRPGAFISFELPNLQH